MEERKRWDRLRENYLNLLVFTLKTNIKATLKDVNVDHSIVLHYAMSIEEDSFYKHQPNLGSYSKAITAARLNIERYTSNQQLHPLISKALHSNEMEKTSEQKCSRQNYGRQNELIETFHCIYDQCILLY